MANFTISSASREVRRFSRFLAVSLVGTLLDLSVLTMLKLLGLPILLANSTSFAIGVVNNSRPALVKSGLDTPLHGGSAAHAIRKKDHVDDNPSYQ